MTPPTRSALLLTEQEWEDLSRIAWEYRYRTDDAINVPLIRDTPGELDAVERRRVLAKRVIEAAE